MPTSPGINSQFEMTIFPADEQRIIRKLSNHFYVTRALKPIEVTNSVYRAFLMRPSDDLSIVLNAERELAVLFCPYESFEARSLNAFDKIYDFFGDQRIDQSIRFLFSLDEKIVSTIQHYLLQNLEYPIIVPCKYKDFTGLQGDDAVIRSIRTNFLTRDLFGHEAPLRQEHFYFGRDLIVKGIVDSHKTGQNAGIFGLRKSGKTSTIFAVQRRAKASQIATITIDCEDTEVHAKRYDQLLFFIVDKIRSHFNLKTMKHESGLSADLVSTAFKEKLSTTLNAARSHVLLIFDEIENISPETASSAHWLKGKDSLYFWQILRSYFQADHKYKITFCFVGTNPKLIETSKIDGVANPAFMFASHNYLAGLDFEDMKEMIVKLSYFMGLQFPPHVIAKIYAKFGGHPFFTRQLCSMIHHEVPLQNRPRTVSDRDYEAAVKRIGGKIKVYLDDIIENLSKFHQSEYEMLKYLANEQFDVFDELAKEFPELIAHILGYGILRPAGDSFEFSFAEIAQYFKNDEVVPDLEKHWSEIMIRRNKIERYIRQELFSHFRRQDSEYVHRKFSDVLKPERIDQFGYDIRVWFSTGGSPIYFSETIKFVEAINLLQEDNNRLVSELWNVNSIRREAHANDISEVEITKARKSFDWIEDMLLPPQ